MFDGAMYTARVFGAVEGAVQEAMAESDICIIAEPLAFVKRIFGATSKILDMMRFEDS